MRVLALTSGWTTPSSRLRVRQHVPALRREGIEVQEAPSPVSLFPASEPGAARWRRRLRGLRHLGSVLAARAPHAASSWRFDLTWLQKELYPGLPTLEPFLHPPVVFDVDDAVWLRGPAGFFACRTLARRSRLVLAGNMFIAERFSSWGARVETVPTGVDTTQFRPSERPEPPAPAVGWIGSRSTLPYLEELAPALAPFFGRNRDWRLLVIADARPRLPEAIGARLDFIPWDPETAPRHLAERARIGVMPAPDDDWARGKCSMKMLQYMACGLPVVVTPVGMNAEVLARGALGIGPASPGEWAEALETLARDPQLRARMGRQGRLVVEQEFSSTIVVERLASILREVVDG